MRSILSDLQYAARTARKQPGFSFIAIVTLALGIGANTVMFSLVNAALLRPLPVARPEQLIALNNTQEGRLFPTFSYPNYRDLRDRNTVFSGLMAYRFAPISLSHDGINERLWGYVVSGNYFDVLGVTAAAGRVIGPDDDRFPGGHPVTVLGHACWRNRFGGDPAIVGKTVTVNGSAYTVIGVAPAGFNGTESIAAPEMWFPMAMQARIEVGRAWLEERGVENIFIQGRLKPGVGQARAQQEVDALAAQLEREFPAFNERKRISLSTPGVMGGMMRGTVVGFAALLMAVVGLVLVLACTNLANLLLAKSAERRREIAVRLALGARRGRLIRQLLTESLLLAGAGGVVGILFAYWMIGVVADLKPPVDVPLFLDLRLDRRVLVFTTLLSLATGVVFGLLPAWQSTRADLLSGLKDELLAGGPARSRLKNGLIVFQMALSLVLLVGGGLMVRGLRQAQTLNLGFDPRNAVETVFDLRLQGYDEARTKEFLRRALDRVQGLPGVTGAGLADLVPVDLHFGREKLYLDGQTPERDAVLPRVMSNRVTPGYFAAMDTRLIRGRNFTDRDDEASPGVAIVNETFARQFFPNTDAIGKSFRIGGEGAPRLEIIGIARNGKYAGLNEEPRPFVYRSLWQSRIGTTSLIARTTRDSRETLAAIQGELRTLDPSLPVSTAKTLTERLALPLLPARFATFTLGGFGVMALVLAAIGLYGVISYTVIRRTREMGVRLALGAQRADVLRLIVGSGMSLTAVGIALGFVVSLGVTRVMKALLFGISPTDPTTFLLVTVLLGLVALAACLIPAWRATRVDPMTALRAE